MAGSAYFAGFVSLPTIITQPGKYLTRSGESVTITTSSSKHEFGCIGFYPSGVREDWHKSGRLFSGRETSNDIVRAA